MFHVCPTVLFTAREYKINIHVPPTKNIYRLAVILFSFSVILNIISNIAAFV